MGSHGNNDAGLADIILPCVAYTEKKTSYLNVEGRLQSTFKSLYGPGDSREEWKIFGALLCFLGVSLPFNSLKGLHSFYKDTLIHNFTTSHLIDYSTNENQKFSTNALSNAGLQNFYLTNAITETSKVMQECSQNRSKVNFF